MFARFSPGEDFAFVMALNVPVPVEWSGSYRDLEVCVEPRLPDRKLVEARLQRLVADAEPGEALGEAQLFRPRARQSAVARPGDFVVLEVSVTHLATGAPVWSFERRVATLSTCEADLLLFSGLGRAMEGRQEGEVAVLEEVETEASDARLPFWMRMGPLAQPPRWRVEARLLRVLGQSSEAALEAWLEARAGKVQSLRDLRVDLAQTLLEESADDARQRAGLALLAALESRLRVPEGLEGRGEGKGASAPGGSAAATAQFRSAAPASSQSAAPLNLDPIPDARHLVLAELLRQALAGSLAPAEARQLGARAQEFLAPGGGGDAAAAALRRAWAGVCDVAAREGLGRDGGGLQDELRRQRGSQAMEDWDKLRFALSEPQVRRLVDLEATLREVTAWAAGWGGVQVRRGAAAEALEESVTRLGAAGLLEINA